MAEAAPRPVLRGAAAGGAIAARPVIALTSGEPAGIGPELCVRLAAERFPARLVAVGDRALLAGFPDIEHVPLSRPRVPGKLDPGNSRYVLAVLERALLGCLSGEYHAMVTAPVQKSVINDAGIAFTGHTEFLAEKARARPCGDDAGGRRPARGARHHASSALRGPACDHARPRHQIAQGRRSGPAHEVQDPEASHPRRRPQPAQRRIGPSRPGGPRNHCTRHQGFRRRRLRTDPGRHAVRAGAAPAGRCGARHVPRPGPAGAQICLVRPRRQRDPWPSLRAHLGRPRHRARPRRHRQGRSAAA